VCRPAAPAVHDRLVNTRSVPPGAGHPNGSPLTSSLRYTSNTRRHLAAAERAPMSAPKIAAVAALRGN